MAQPVSLCGRCPEETSGRSRLPSGHQVLASHHEVGYDAERVSTLDSGAHPEWHPGLGSAEDTGPEGCDAFNRKPLQTNQPVQTLLGQSCSQTLESPLSGQEREELTLSGSVGGRAASARGSREDPATLPQGPLLRAPASGVDDGGRGREEGGRPSPCPRVWRPGRCGREQ